MASSLPSIFDSIENTRSSVPPDLIFLLDLAQGPVIEAAEAVLKLLHGFGKLNGEYNYCLMNSLCTQSAIL